MISVAICDDIPAAGEAVHGVLSAFGAQNNHNFSIQHFTSGRSLTDRLEIEYFDIIFLDVQLQNESGIDVGREIRQSTLNGASILVFMSVADAPASKIASLAPLEYTLKPVTMESIGQVMAQAVQVVTERNQRFTARTAHKTHHVPLKDILYFESDRRLIHIHTAKESLTCYGKLNEIQSSLRSSQFIRIHHSYLVNFAHIQSYNTVQLQVTLPDGRVLPISQSKRKTAYQAFTKLIEVCHGN